MRPPPPPFIWLQQYEVNPSWGPQGRISRASFKSEARLGRTLAWQLYAANAEPAGVRKLRLNPRLPRPAAGRERCRRTARDDAFRLQLIRDPAGKLPGLQRHGAVRSA